MCGERSDKPATARHKMTPPARAVLYCRVMPREEFQHELDEIEALLQDEGRLCGHSLETVLNGLHAADDTAAQKVIAADDEVDSIYLRVESAIESLFARQAPVAVDLRLVVPII